MKADRTDHAAAIVDETKQLLPGYEVRPLKDFLSLMTSSNIPGLGAFINTAIAIAVAVGFLVIFLFRCIRPSSSAAPAKSACSSLWGLRRPISWRSF